VFLVLGGLVIGFVPGLPAPRVPPEVIFLVFLPPLLNYAAFFSSPRELRAHLRPIALLAIGLVLFTMAAVALVAHFLIGMPLVLQGLTMGPLISALRLKSEDEADKVEELRTRLEGARAALERLERLDDNDRVASGATERTREQYEERIRRYRAGIEAGGTTEEYAESSAAWRAWRLELVKAEREAVLSKRDRGEISPEVMRRVMRDLDLEESRLDG
jgi:hypothetical protein